MHCLVVLAHPLDDSLNAHLAGRTVAMLERAGHEVTLLDLCRDGFDPRLSEAERRAYYTARPETDLAHARMLAGAECLVLVFPTWWFGLPAILKGWIDRVFSPGVAFDHGKDFGPITPLLSRLRSVVAVTTLGSPWWVDRLVMRRPVRRVLSTGLFRACAPQARFTYFPVYSAERLSAGRIEAVERRLAALLERSGRRTA